MAILFIVFLSHQCQCLRVSLPLWVDPCLRLCRLRSRWWGVSSPMLPNQLSNWSRVLIYLLSPLVSHIPRSFLLLTSILRELYVLVRYYIRSQYIIANILLWIACSILWRYSALVSWLHCMLPRVSCPTGRLVVRFQWDLSCFWDYSGLTDQHDSRSSR